MLNPFHWAKFLAFIYFSLSSKKTLILNGFLRTFQCSKFCCSIFKDRCPPNASPRRTALLLYPITFRLSSTFLNFFQVFFRTRKPVSDTHPRPPEGALVYHLFPLLSRAFLKVFEVFSDFSAKNGESEKTYLFIIKGLTGAWGLW